MRILDSHSWRSIVAAALCVAVVVLIFAFGCTDSTSPDGDEAHFEVHEWGVMVGCETDSAFFATSRPEMTTLVRIPVIYFHSTEKSPFTAKVKFTDGDSIVTYPDAVVSGDSIVWSDVAFSSSDTTVPDLLSRGFVPLEDIIPTLDDVDADMLECNGAETRFLFYEGESTFRNEISVAKMYGGLSVILKNNGNYTCYNLILVHRDDFLSNYFATADSLAPGQEDTVELAPMSAIPSAASDLVSLGFTAREANSFSSLWDPPFFQVDDPGSTMNLIYRIPQTEYDRLISLEIDPEPDKVIRAMYVLVHLAE